MRGLEQASVWRDRMAALPVVSSGLSLMTGTIMTSALGLVFWIVAARLYDPADFGVATTAVYTMMMLADVACVGLRTGLVRYLPTAGRRAPATILWGYGIVVVAAAVIGTTFLLGLDVWADELDVLRAALLVAGFFVVATAFWALFMLEDAVLVGLRKAPWVPVENTLFGLAKIALLFPLASISPTLGIFWAWTIPVFPIVIGINALVARTVRTPMEPEEPPPASLLRDMLSFSLADWLAALARLAALGIIPLMVLAREGGAAAAYFQAAWLIAFTVFALSSNAAYALLAETSYERTSLDRNSVHAGALTLALTAPIIVVGALGAPLLLLVYGDDYAANSSWVLRILLVAALPNAIHQLYIGRLRSRNRIARVVVLETLLSALVVGLTALLLPRFGIAGVGVAWLVGLSVLAAYAVAVESEWWWASRLDTGALRRVGAALRAARRPGPAAGRRLATVLERMGLPGARTSDHRTDGHVERAIVAPTGDGQLVVELAATAAGADVVTARRRAVQRVGSSPAGPALASILPVIHAAGDESPTFTAWLRAPGVRASEAVSDGVPIEALAPLVVDAVEAVHRVTARPITIDADLVDRWVAPALDHLSMAGQVSATNRERLRRRLTDELIGASTDVAMLHGHLTLRHAMVTVDPLAVTAVVDWADTGEGPAIIDAATLALTSLASSAGREVGAVVVDLLDDPHPFESHPAMVGRPRGTLGATTVVLLAWLRLVGGPRPAGHLLTTDRFWLARNARPVLVAVGSAAGEPALRPTEAGATGSGSG